MPIIIRIHDLFGAVKLTIVIRKLPTPVKGREATQVRSEHFRVFRVFRGCPFFVNTCRPKAEHIEPRKTQKTRKPDCDQTRRETSGVPTRSLPRPSAIEFRVPPRYPCRDERRWQPGERTNGVDVGTPRIVNGGNVVGKPKGEPTPLHRLVRGFFQGKPLLLRRKP